MSSPRALVFLSIFLPAVLAPLEISAAELRILDSLGLTRAVKSVEKAAKVIITASIEEDKSQPADLYLSHVDGQSAPAHPLNKKSLAFLLTASEFFASDDCLSLK